ncbi:MAG: hypothetical protein NTW21_35425, partial [Verrucomicrobia bacterium]|nr:hypothetical protein [Verrucomicrobiota bacterium]
MLNVEILGVPHENPAALTVRQSGVAGCALPTALQTLARAWAGESMECGGKRSAAPLWLSPGACCGPNILRVVTRIRRSRSQHQNPVGGCGTVSNVGA